MLGKLAKQETWAAGKQAPKRDTGAGPGAGRLTSQSGAESAFTSWGDQVRQTPYAKHENEHGLMETENM